MDIFVFVEDFESKSDTWTGLLLHFTKTFSPSSRTNVWYISPHCAHECTGDCYSFSICSKWNEGAAMKLRVVNFTPSKSHSLRRRTGFGQKCHPKTIPLRFIYNVIFLPFVLIYTLLTTKARKNWKIWRRRILRYQHAKAGVYKISTRPRELCICQRWKSIPWLIASRRGSKCSLVNAGPPS